MMRGILDTAIEDWEEYKKNYSSFKYDGRGHPEIKKMINNSEHIIRIMGDNIEIDVCNNLYGILYKKLEKGIETRIIFSKASKGLIELCKLQKIFPEKLKLYLALGNPKQYYMIFDDRDFLIVESLKKIPKKATTCRNNNELAKKLSGIFDNYQNSKTFELN